MATSTTADIVAYYQDILILQYTNLAKASGTIGLLASAGIEPQTSTQTVVFSLVATTGTVTFVYNGVATAAINWNDSNGTIQTKLRAVSGLSAVTVAGTITGQTLTVTFTGVASIVALPLTVGVNSLLATATPVGVTITETDVILPLAVQDGFDLTGSNIASGVQLDILGKYTGVSRTANGFFSVVTLNDSDFLSLIRMAIAKNNAGSSLSDIQALIHQFFDGEMLVFDYTTMNMSYFISSSVGSQNLVQLFITEKILPAPMGVAVIVIYVPTVTLLFGFRTYSLPAYNVEPFNTYSVYHMDWTFLSYANAIIPP